MPQKNCNNILLMDTVRQNKVARLLQKELGQFLQTEGSNYVAGVMLTVTVVRVTPDMGLAKVYVSAFPAKDKEEVIQTLNDAVKSIRYLLGKRIRHQLRIVPELHFYLDDSLDLAEKIDDLLK